MDLKPASNDFDHTRVNSILETIISFARLDFTKKTEVCGKNDMLDAIGAGVNMLGEELENSTVSLKEKEQLLKEIHHRVKNNLQIVSSLLSLQNENVIDEKYQSLIMASRNRINSMALVHEMLYSGADLKYIRVAEYIPRLSQNVLASISKPGSDIRFSFRIPNHLAFDIDHMIPLGLIMNEIITNSLKYAFPHNSGTITLSIEEFPDRNVFCFSDNGVGLPEGFDMDKNSRLGMQLIQMLTSQLGGELSLSSSGGTMYNMTLKKT